MAISGRSARIGFVLALLLTGLALMLRGIFDPQGEWQPFAPEEDGSWAAVSIDGRPVPPADYRLAIRAGAVAGGRDGCNDWSFTDDPPAANGMRMIVATLQLCPEDPVRTAYRKLAAPGARITLADGMLRVVGGGHEGLFRRCAWRTVRSQDESSSSRQSVCVPEEIRPK